MKRIAQMGVMLSFTLILSYIESFMPLSLGIPGVKLGLANFGIVCTLYLWGAKEAICIDLLRIVLASFLFGNMSMMLYSLSGGIVSIGVMIVMKHLGCFSSIGVSMGGGVFHNVGQLLVAYVVVHTSGLLFYLPFLLLTGLATGFIIGVLQKAVHPRLLMIMKAGE